MDAIENYIDGKLVKPLGENYFPGIEPATGKAYVQIPNSDFRDIELAVSAAKKAFLSWSDLSKQKRSEILVKLANLIKEHAEILAEQESRDNGKPISLARSVDIPRAEANIRFFATASLHFFSESHSMENQAINYTLRKPIGIVGAISPWNLPLYLFTWKIAPALAAGNCVVAKPSEITPMSAYTFSKLCIKAGLPPGVLNIVHGTGTDAGEAMVKHPAIDVISFTGGTRTGKRIAEIAAPQFKKLSLELGGKNPNIIFADCNFDRMMKTTLHSSFANQGQICLCGSRILVEDKLYDRFKSRFVEEVKRLKVSYPSDPEADLGAVVSKPHHDKILNYIENARKEGGIILTGGNSVSLPGEFSKGYYIEPTVIEGLDNTCQINQEEVFGPVVTLQSFASEQEAVDLANGTEYGLSATIWTEQITRAHRLASAIEAGIVWINCWLVRDLRTPFGGTKQSGVGREGGFEALRFFTEPKNVCISLKP
jgi:aminomuconate-semialdehyde/2-hydroxymuconate-6-semialdehyde dehydrogenase